uniref:Peptidase S1 domain-containing protein n=1 Tax=Pectinophora gossypiella TaxID=13191 RepID=A0A1E1WTE4_PECGO
MRALLLFSLGLVAVVTGREAPVMPLLNYHETVGIPLAKSIKDAEDAIHSPVSGRSAQNDSNMFIVGGVIATADAHPYLAGLVISLVGIAGNSACGSSLLTTNRLVTAAHCWTHGTMQAWQFTVVLGSQFLFYGGTRIATSQVILHPQYVSQFLMNDVAMIYLPTPVTFTQSIQPVALPSGTQLWDTFAGTWAIAAGYGKVNDQQTGVSTATQVSEVFLQVITYAQCVSIYGSSFITPSTLCTSGTGSVGVCGGDSGGPLVSFQNGQRTLIGISSFAANVGCQLGHPSGFARVTSFMSFITQHMF